MIKNESSLYKTRAVHLFLFVLVQVEDALEVNTFIWIREQNADRHPKFGNVDPARQWIVSDGRLLSEQLVKMLACPNYLVDDGSAFGLIRAAFEPRIEYFLDPRHSYGHRIEEYRSRSSSDVNPLSV